MCVCVCLTQAFVEKVDTHRYEDLGAAVYDLYVLVVHEAAHDGDVGLAVGSAHARLGHLLPHTPRAVLTPPRVVGRDVEGQQCAVLEGQTHTHTDRKATPSGTLTTQRLKCTHAHTQEI